MAYQQCRYNNQVEKIPIQCINGQNYLVLQDVHDCFPDIRRFTCNGNPISFEVDKNNVRLKPERIQALPENIIDCHKPTSGADDSFDQQILFRLYKELTEMWKSIETLNTTVQAGICQTRELVEFTVPRLFIVLPEDTPLYNPKNWFGLKYRLHFLCECENGERPHFAFHEGYQLKKPREFLRKYGPYLRKMITVVKYAVPFSSLVAPQLTSITSGIVMTSILKDKHFWNNLSTRIDRLDEILKKVEKDVKIPTEEKLQCVEGADLRGIQGFLEKTDTHRTYGNLFRSTTTEGHVRWMCIQHHKEQYTDTRRQDLQKEFQNLGGEIEEEVVIVKGEAANQFVEMLKIFRQGLPIFSITLKDLKLKEYVFDDLLDFVSHQPSIQKLHLENVSIVGRMRSIYKRVVISKLEETMKKNSILNVQYSLIKPLSKFPVILKDTMSSTISSVTFQMRSQEDIPALELAGTDKTGFTLLISNCSEKDNINYQTAIKSLLSLVPNITKIILRNGVISESIWTCFCEFLTTNQTLQELTVDCCLTLEQTKDLSHILDSNKILKTLNIINVWERKDELKGFEEIFKILYTNTTLTEFNLKCHTDLLKLSFIARCLLQNRSLRVLRLPKCRIYQNTDIGLLEEFLLNTSLYILSFESISTNCEIPVERLIGALNKNESLEILQLNGVVCVSSVKNRIDSSPHKFGQILALLNGK